MQGLRRISLTPLKPMAVGVFPAHGNSLETGLALERRSSVGRGEKLSLARPQKINTIRYRLMNILDIVSVEMIFDENGTKRVG